MPQLSQRPCAAGHCPSLATPPARYCESHHDMELQVQQRAPDHRASSTKRGYDRDWRTVRAAKLQAAFGFCEAKLACAGAPMILRIAVQVHHVQRLASRPDLRLEQGNLMAVCRACHAELTKQVQ